MNEPNRVIAALQKAVEASDPFGYVTIQATGLDASTMMDVSEVNDFLESLAPSPATVLERLADDMLEAARYVKNDVELVRSQIEEFHCRLSEAAEIDWKRISDNLYVGAKWLVVQPSLAEGYLRGAAFELKERAGRLRDACD